MSNELRELETITKEYLNKLDVLLQNTYKKANIKPSTYNNINPYENIDNISIIHDIETAQGKACEILSDLGKFNTIKKYNFTSQELRILLFIDYFFNADNTAGNSLNSMLKIHLNISKRTLETHYINIANKIIDLLEPYIDDDTISINENNNARNPQQLIKNFLWEYWQYLK